MFTVWYGISCSFLVIITHSCCALVCYYHQKAHSIPYHTVSTWNSVVNPSISWSWSVCKGKYWMVIAIDPNQSRDLYLINSTTLGELDFSALCTDLCCKDISPLLRINQLLYAEAWEHRYEPDLYINAENNFWLLCVCNMIYHVEWNTIFCGTNHEKMSCGCYGE